MALSLTLNTLYYISLSLTLNMLYYMSLSLSFKYIVLHFLKFDIIYIVLLGLKFAWYFQLWDMSPGVFPARVTEGASPHTHRP